MTGQYFTSQTTNADNIIVWIMVGLLFLWVVSFVAEIVMAKLRPVLMFIVAAAFIGVFVMNVFGKL